MGKQWTEEQKQHVVNVCNQAKANHENVGEVLRTLGASSSQLCEWRKKFRGEKKIEVPLEVFEEFKVKPTSRQVIIDDYDHCCAVVVALVMSGYTVSQIVRDRKHFINYE